MDNCNSIINKIYLKIKLNEIQKKKRIAFVVNFYVTNPMGQAFY